MDEAAEGRRRAAFGFRTAYLLVLGGALLGLLWGLSSPAAAFPLTVASGLVVLLAGAVWGTAVVVVGWRWLRARQRPTRAGWLLVAPALVVVAGSLGAVDVPLRARFALSRGALEDVVEGEDRTGRAGLYRVTHVSEEGDGVYLEVEGGFFVDGGFALLPSGPPDPDHDGFARTYRHLGGDWYAYTEGFD